MPQVISTLFFLVILFLSIDVHEFSHAIVADRLGDGTPRRQGRITLNPIAHMDPTGTLMILISSISGFGIGWGKPVQVNPRNFSISPRAGMGIVAIAGPLSNIVLAVIGAVVYRLVGPFGYPGAFLGAWVQINLGLALFNMLPVFPLDGYNVLLAILSAIRQNWARQLADFWQKQVQYGPMVLLLLLAIGWINPALSPIDWLIARPMFWLANLLLHF